MQPYNNDSQWSKVKGAFAQTQSRSYNKMPEISFVDGLSADKKKTFTQTGSTPSSSKNTPWLSKLMGASEGRS